MAGQCFSWRVQCASRVVRAAVQPFSHSSNVEKRTYSPRAEERTGLPGAWQHSYPDVSGCLFRMDGGRESRKKKKPRLFFSLFLGHKRRVTNPTSTMLQHASDVWKHVYTSIRGELGSSYSLASLESIQTYECVMRMLRGCCRQMWKDILIEKMAKPSIQWLRQNGSPFRVLQVPLLPGLLPFPCFPADHIINADPEGKAVGALLDSSSWAAFVERSKVAAGGCCQSDHGRVEEVTPEGCLRDRR